MKTPQLHPLDRTFAKLRLGLAIFFLGCVGLYITSQAMRPGLGQEIVSLLCLAIMGLGFIIAIAAELYFIFLRIKMFLKDE